MSTLAVIPARYASTRLPGKPLQEISGIPLVVRVLKQVQRCATVDRVIVATDDAVLVIDRAKLPSLRLHVAAMKSSAILPRSIF